MIIRIIIASAVVVLAFMLWQRLRRIKKPPSDQTESTQFRDTVSCKTCGLRLPRAEALQQGEDYFCCREHMHE